MTGPQPGRDQPGDKLAGHGPDLALVQWPCAQADAPAAAATRASEDRPRVLHPYTMPATTGCAPRAPQPGTPGRARYIPVGIRSRWRKSG
jgi:hypothetical protein